MAQEFEIITRSLKRTRVFLVGLGIFAIGMVVAGGVTLIIYILPRSENLSAIFRIGFTLFNLFGMILFLRKGIPLLTRGMYWWNVEQSPPFTLLKEYPQQIVWIFEVPTNDKGQAPMVNVWLADGEKYGLYVKAEDKNALIQALSRFAPKARLGYQPEWVKEYEQDSSIFGQVPTADSQKPIVR